MKKLILYTFLLLGFVASAQKNPSELGEFVYKALRSQNLKAVATYLGTPDEVLLFSKKLGRSFSTKEETEDFKKDQAEMDSSFIRKCQLVLEDGKQRSIVWQKTEFIEVKLHIDTYQLSSLDESKTIDFGYIEVIFSHEGKQYMLTLETAFDAIGRWRLTGDKITLESYTE